MIKASRPSEVFYIILQAIANLNCIFLVFYLLNPSVWLQIAGIPCYIILFRSFYLANTTHTIVDKTAQRTSYCKRCKTYISHRDHHCVFIGRCIQKANYRYFLTYVLYSYGLSTLLLMTSINYFPFALLCYTHEAYGYFVCLIFSLLSSGFFFFMTGALFIEAIGSIFLGVYLYEQIKKIKDSKFNKIQILKMWFTTAGRTILYSQFAKNWKEMVGECTLREIIFTF